MLLPKTAKEQVKSLERDIRNASLVSLTSLEKNVRSRVEGALYHAAQTQETDRAKRNVLDRCERLAVAIRARGILSSDAVEDERRKALWAASDFKSSLEDARPSQTARGLSLD